MYSEYKKGKNKIMKDKLDENAYEICADYCLRQLIKIEIKNYLKRQVDDLWKQRRKMKDDGLADRLLYTNRVIIDYLVKMLKEDFNYEY